MQYVLIVDGIVADTMNRVTLTPTFSKINSVGSVNGEYLVTGICVLMHYRLQEGIEKNMENETMSFCLG